MEDAKNYAFSLAQKPRGFKGVKSGKRLTLFRGDKIELLLPDQKVIKPEKEGLICRGAKTTGEQAKAYLAQVKALLETETQPTVEVAKDLADFFPHQAASHVAHYAKRISKVALPYQTWCDYFIDIHTSKSCMDPFISVTQSQEVARAYSSRIDETIYTVKTKGHRTLNDARNRGRSNGTEVFVLGAITPEEINITL